MWKQLYDAIKQLLLLTHQTERNREEIKELGQQVRELARAIERLAYEVHRVNERTDYASTGEIQSLTDIDLLHQQGRNLGKQYSAEIEAPFSRARRS